MRVPPPLIVSDILWALPECVSGGTVNTRRDRCLRLVLVGSPTCTCRKRALARRIVPSWHLRRVQALATLPHTSAPISVVHGALAVGLPPCARGVRGLRVPPKLAFCLLWALPECASGGTGNTRREKVLKARARWFSNLHLPQARAGSTLRPAVVGFRPWPPCHTPPLPSVLCSSCTCCWAAAIERVGFEG